MPTNTNRIPKHLRSLTYGKSVTSVIRSMSNEELLANDKLYSSNTVNDADANSNIYAIELERRARNARKRNKSRRPTEKK